MNDQKNPSIVQRRSFKKHCLNDGASSDGLTPVPYAEGYYTTDSVLSVLPQLLQGEVAVIDSGVNAAHEDLADTAISGMNFLGAEETRDETAYGDDQGHGTLVCGILSAQSDNALGGSGLCPQAELLALRCFSGVGGQRQRRQRQRADGDLRHRLCRGK